MQSVNNKPIILLFIFWFAVLSPLWLVLLAPKLKLFTAKLIKRYKEKSFTDYTSVPKSSYVPKMRPKTIIVQTRQSTVDLIDQPIAPSVTIKVLPKVVESCVKTKIRSAVMPDPNVKAPKFKEFLG